MIIALDFETSGTDPRVNAPVSIGVALMEGEEVIDIRHKIIAPPMYKGKITKTYDVCALEISGLTWEEIKGGQSATAVLFDLSAWSLMHDAKRLPVVAYNAPFDLSFYSELLFMGRIWNNYTKSFQRAKPPFVGPWQCALMMAVDSLDLDAYSLDAVADHFGLARSSEKHNALDDAILAGKIYAKLTEAA